MSFSYNYYCSKCGHSESLPTKAEWRATKNEHKRGGCSWRYTPDKDGFLMVRPQLANEARMGKDMLLANELALEIENTKEDSTDEPVESEIEDNEKCEGPLTITNAKEEDLAKYHSDG